MLVVDCCAGTFSVANGCMLLPLHTRFVGCDLYFECILNEEWDITGDDDVHHVASTIVDAMEEQNP